MTAFQHIVGATDGSDTCALAVRTAIDLCLATGARLTVVSAVAHLPTDADLDSAIDPLGAAEEASAALRRGDPDAASRAATECARVAADEATARGIEARWVAWEGTPGEAILAAAASVGADLIVVGSHARGGLGRLVLGSVSDHVVRHAPVPVLVIRPGQPKAAGV